MYFPMCISFRVVNIFWGVVVTGLIWDIIIQIFSFYNFLKKSSLSLPLFFLFDSYCKLATYFLYLPLWFLSYCPEHQRYLPVPWVLAGACGMTQYPLSWICRFLDLDNFRTKALNLTFRAYVDVIFWESKVIISQ